MRRHERDRTPESGRARAAARRTTSSPEPWDPYVSEKLTAEQESYYMAGQWKLMWWRFRRHRPAVVSAVFLLLMYFSIFDQRVDRALRPAHAARRVHLRAAAGRASVPRGQLRRAVRLRLKMELDLDTLQRVYTEDHGKPQPLRFFCRGERYEFWGVVPGLVPSRLPGRGRHLLPARHRPAGARHVLAHRLCRAHLAHHRPHRHRAELHARR